MTLRAALPVDESGSVSFRLMHVSAPAMTTDDPALIRRVRRYASDVASRIADRSRLPEARLFVVAECPVCPGAGCVVALKSIETGRLVYFAPCCGIAWQHAPLDGRLDKIESLADLGVATVSIPTSDEVTSAGLRVLRDESLDIWSETIALPRAQAHR
jgi:hypothetical protein